MIVSRSLDDLQPHVREKCHAHISACANAGIDIIITCTLRDWEAQQAAYAAGRSAPGPRVTNAAPGDSAHQYGLAYDVVPIRNGKPVWGTIADIDRQLWEKVGEIGEACGLEWAGRWRTMIEMAHFQDLGGLTIAQLKADYLQQKTGVA